MSRPSYQCSVCSVALPRKAMRHHCNACNVLLCGKHIYSWIDGNNRAITKASPELCESCYRARYCTRPGQTPSTRPGIVYFGQEIGADGLPVRSAS